MKVIPTESFGFTVKFPQPQDFDLSDEDIRIFTKKNTLLRFFDSEYSKISHKKDAFHRFEAAKQNHALMCYRAREEFWLSMNPQKFEEEVARVFTALGWIATVTGGTGDRGVDIRLQKDNKLAVAQCKAYNKKVGPPAVRELHSVIVSTGAHKGYLVSLRGFSRGAIEEVNGKPIMLVHAGHLVNAELISVATNLGEHHMKGSPLLWDD